MNVFTVNGQKKQTLLVSFWSNTADYKQAIYIIYS